MSYEVESKPKKLVAKTTNGKVYLWFEDYGEHKPAIRMSTRPSENAPLEASLLAAGATNAVELSYEQFFEIIDYVFGNENLSKNDQRLSFLEKIRAARVVEGHGGRGKRLEIL